MFVLSQGKNMIFPMEGIYLSAENQRIFIAGLDLKEGDGTGYMCVGIYDNNVRAMEVLMDIFKSLNFNNPLYAMPEK